MLLRFLQNSEFSQLFKLVSPDFFRVVPAASLLQTGKNLMKNHANVQLGSEVARALNSSIRSQRMRVLAEMTQTNQMRPLSADRELHHTQGQSILELFFLQIFLSEQWLLDFRTERFSVTQGGALEWAPGNWFLTLSPSFVKSIRNLYIGFYTEDDLLFTSALESLGLLSARQNIRNHFKSGNQESVQFKLKDFQKTFADIFESCAREKAVIHPEFAALGILLLTLYENLETTQAHYSVRTAFFKAHEFSQAKLNSSPQQQGPK